MQPIIQMNVFELTIKTFRILTKIHFWLSTESGGLPLTLISIIVSLKTPLNAVMTLIAAILGTVILCYVHTNTKLTNRIIQVLGSAE